jgi:hypothetical protein
VACLDVSGFYSKDSRSPILHIQFNAGNTGDRFYQSGVFLDSVQLKASPASAPVPPSMFMLASGMMGVLVLRRKRK